LILEKKVVEIKSASKLEILYKQNRRDLFVYLISVYKILVYFLLDSKRILPIRMLIGLKYKQILTFKSQILLF